MLETAAEKGKNLEPWEVLQYFDSLLRVTREIFIYLAFFTSFTPHYHLFHRSPTPCCVHCKLATAALHCSDRCTACSCRGEHCIALYRAKHDGMQTAAVTNACMSAGNEVI